MKTELKVRLLSHTPNPDMVVAKAAKLCYSQIGINDMELTDKEARKFVNMLGNMGHYSPFEHASFTFAIEGVSRALTHQLVRHRIASFSQQSQRYVKLSQFEYIIPEQIENDPIAKNIYIEAMKDDQRAYTNIYNRLLEKKAVELGVVQKYLVHCNQILKDKYALNVIPGIDLESIKCYPGIPTLEDFWIESEKELPRNKRTFSAIQKSIIEDCRYVFPNACETKICVTMNARSLINFLHHRCCDRAQWEIRELAEAIYRLVIEIAPALFVKAGPNCVSGPCPEGSMSCGKQLEMKNKYSLQEGL